MSYPHEACIGSIRPIWDGTWKTPKSIEDCPLIVGSLFNSIMKSDDTNLRRSSAVIEVPGGMHSYQIMTEPETMDKQEMGVGFRFQSYRLQYGTIDELTQAGDLTNEVSVSETQPVALGGFSDIYRGLWRHRVSIDNDNEFHDATTPVAVKLLRAFTRRKVDLPRAKKHLRKEAAVWKRLKHQNIARFYGVSFQFEGRPAVVMQWYKNGTAPQYLEHQPDTKRIEMVVQVARGLRYLHVDAGQIVHGDIKGNNILVSDDGYALLSDFGLAGVVEDFAGSEANTTAMSGSLRWQAPELLAMDDDVDSNKTLASDVWALACTAFELLNGNLPYHWFNYDYAILRAIYKGQKPVRKNDTNGRLAGILQEKLGDCWARAAAERPGMDEIVQRLDSIAFEFDG